MKTALITTTINIPTVLALYRKHGPEVRFFVALEHKTPMEAVEYIEALPSAIAIYPEWQEKYKCSDLIGRHTIARRNIALLEALKWGAEVIVTIDDDNIPLSENYFAWQPRVPLEYFYGLSASSPSGWFDPGQLLVPQTPHRGFPYEKKAAPVYAPAVDVKIGVAAGLCLGDPDIDAVTRIANAPIVHSVSELGRSGVVVDPRQTKTVFNTQNTAFIRELAPAMFCCNEFRRFDDILASLVTQRVMRERELHVHFGQPFIWQQRNAHNLLDDLSAEIAGMRYILEFSEWLDSIKLGSGSVVEQVRTIFTKVPNDQLAASAAEQYLAWCEDCESVL